MLIRKATFTDCLDIAELALMAGEGIPAFFWEQSRKPGQTLEQVGAENLTSEDENFSYRNVHVAEVDGKLAGMMLAYRLPEKEDADNLDELPEFIRPLVELEQCVPGSFYVNMIATYPEYRNRGIGSGLMGIVDSLARAKNCKLTSVEVFEENSGALRLYRRLGFGVMEKRPVIPHSCHPHSGNILLLTRNVSDA